MTSNKYLHKLCLTLSLSLALFISTAEGAEKTLNIAAASNLTYVMPEIVKVFEKTHKGIKTKLSLASSGSIYSQIINGAPYDVFLSADELRPSLLYKEGKTIGKPFTYATGKLVLWTGKKMTLVEGLFVLSSPKVKRVAIANPRHAPYGEAAKKTLIDAGLWEVIQSKLIYGENIGQAAHFVSSGSADVGVIAESMLKSPVMASGTSYLLPEGSYDPITQYGVVIKNKRGNRERAQLFRKYLKSDIAQAIFKDYGYGVE
ncbi:MAG: molybdate ABC transporter substrate-binding protein [Deltaproteobacteria bacterium]|nr:molybdate ABC transporter substrate-binding protein [Deltaproteobacteria bacterium]